MTLRHVPRFVTILLGCVIASGTSAQSMPTDQTLDLPLSSGVTQRLLRTAPHNPRGTIVMQPGGAGDVGAERDGSLKRGYNFVVRTRAAWNARGYAVLIRDTISGENLKGTRSSPDYAQLVQDIVRFAHGQARAPVLLLGTSQGSIAAMNGAAHAAPGSINGVILTESVSVMGGSGETVFDARPDKVRVPALVVANRDDRCNVAPLANATKIAAAMTASPDDRVLFVAGENDHDGNDCGSLSPHGYSGIEPKVVAAITNWMDAHSMLGRKAQ